MLRKHFMEPRNFLRWACVLFICSAFLGAALVLRSFPEYLLLLEGRAETFDLARPFSARLEISDHAVAVAGSSDAPVLNNITIDCDSDIDNSQTLTLSVLGIPVKNVAVGVLPDIELVPCGMTVGIRIDATGLMVLGTGTVTAADGTSSRPCEGKIKSGDLLLKIDKQDIASHQQFKSYIEALTPGCTVSLVIQRGDQNLTVSVSCAVSGDDGKNKLGLWIRDSTKGIGTITYYNPTNSRFAALGHGVVDVDTKQLIPVKDGRLYSASIAGVKKGKKGSPGELLGDIDKNYAIGVITENSSVGLYGTINKGFARLPAQSMHIALQGDVHEGPATMLANVSGTEIKQYDIYIERVNRYTADSSKGIVIRVTDQELITRTGGIVQGMSGCPIIQNGRLIGAVTHVFIQNPLKGYGIFIENMLKQAAT